MTRPRIHALLLGAGAPVSDFTDAIHGHYSDTSDPGSSAAPPRPLAGGEASMSADMVPARGRLSFRRIVDVPFETCVAALDSWQRTGQGGELRFGGNLLRGPVEHDRGTGTRRIQVRLARGPLRPLLQMRLDIDRWCSASTVLELIPGGRVRPTAAYFRAGHLLLDLLIRSLSQSVPPTHARGTANQPYAVSWVSAHSVNTSARSTERSAGP